MIKKRQVILCILDGWGHRQEEKDNGIFHAKTPSIEEMARLFPTSLLQASEGFVGLPAGQMGNSEVGHMHLGAGRLIQQDLPRIDTSLETGQWAAHPLWEEVFRDLKASGRSFHLMGLLSPGGVHSHQNHLMEVLQILHKAGIPTWFHAFLDGRDTPPQSALEFVASVRARCPFVQFGTVGGRYFGMDRDQRWDRVQKAYEAMVWPHRSLPAKTPEALIQTAYEQGVTDEFILPQPLEGYEGMKAGDGLMMGNFRADRAREILSAFLKKDFQGFPQEPSLTFSHVLGLTSYASDLDPLMDTFFPPQTLQHLLGDVVASAGLRQLRLAETEKYAHVTFFFNGGREDPLPGERRILVPSPAVATYDLQPHMSASQVTHHLVAEILHPQAELIVVNYANPDMVGHTGKWSSVLQALAAVDECLGQVWKAVEEKEATLIITADHGNAEMMVDPETGQPHTAHTCCPVPFMLVNPPAGIQGVRDGTLADVAPTILDLWGLPQPKAMTGKSLLKREVV